MWLRSLEFVVKMASNCGDRFLILGTDAPPTVIKFGNLHKIFIMATLSLFNGWSEFTDNKTHLALIINHPLQTDEQFPCFEYLYFILIQKFFFILVLIFVNATHNKVQPVQVIIVDIIEGTVRKKLWLLICYFLFLRSREKARPPTWLCHPCHHQNHPCHHTGWFF